MYNKKGISLIVLVIVIVILIILATVVFKVADSNNFSETISELEFKKEISSYADAVNNNIMDEYTTDKTIFDRVIEDKDEIVKYCDTILQSKYISCMLIKNGKLTLRKNMLTTDEVKWSKEVGIPLI